MQAQGLSAAIREQLARTPGQMPSQSCRPCRTQDWHEHLAHLNITRERHVRMATEGALPGSLRHKGFNPDLAIVSDGARSFAVGLHALCRIHAAKKP